MQLWPAALELGWRWRCCRGRRNRWCCLQEVSHTLEKGWDTRHCHGDGGKNHARLSSSWPCRPQQIPQKLKKMEDQWWRAEEVEVEQVLQGQGHVGGASTGRSSGRGWRWSYSRVPRATRTSCTRSCPTRPLTIWAKEGLVPSLAPCSALRLGDPQNEKAKPEQSPPGLELLGSLAPVVLQ